MRLLRVYQRVFGFRDQAFRVKVNWSQEPRIPLKKGLRFKRLALGVEVVRV